MNDVQEKPSWWDQNSLLILIFLGTSVVMIFFLAGYVFGSYRTSLKKQPIPNYFSTNTDANLPLSLETPGIQSTQIIYTFAGHIANIVPLRKNEAGITIYGIQLSYSGEALPFHFEIAESSPIITGVQKDGKTVPLKFTDLKKGDPLTIDYTADLKKSKNLYVIRMVKIL